jgi:hypothetical protein
MTSSPRGTAQPRARTHPECPRPDGPVLHHPVQRDVVDHNHPCHLPVLLLGAAATICDCLGCSSTGKITDLSRPIGASQAHMTVRHQPGGTGPQESSTASGRVFAIGRIRLATSTWVFRRSTRHAYPDRDPLSGIDLHLKRTT